MRTQSDQQIFQDVATPKQIISPLKQNAMLFKKPDQSNYQDVYGESGDKHPLTTSMKNLKQDSAERAFFELQDAKNSFLLEKKEHLD